MKRPDTVFQITVHPVVYVHPCTARLAEESQGLYGFHLSDRCPNCQTEVAGWELWGENGHCQGRAPTRERLAYMLRYRASQQWRTQAGEIMGYQFRQGSEIRYTGSPVEQVTP